jgi:hypothetical protein
LQVFSDNDGLWLLAKSSVLPGLAQEATFLVALPFQTGLLPRTWAYWSGAGVPRWIGPRHTNFQDGTVCAFSPDENAWSEGGDLRTLLDLYSVWTLRHLHLDLTGLWPGKQYAMIGSRPELSALYRISECEPQELCGCGSEKLTYAECCQPKDSALPRMALIELFMREIPGGFASRRPPPQIDSFIKDQTDLPPMKDVHLVMRLGTAARSQ